MCRNAVKIPKAKRTIIRGIVFSGPGLSSMSPAHIFFFFNWNSLHARLNSHYEAWSYKKKKTKKITGYRKSV